ncbi:MAG: hypothetical protein ACI8SJ_000492 [Shewanella sp.]|jgi:hypothetical protein
MSMNRRKAIGQIIGLTSIAAGATLAPSAFAAVPATGAATGYILGPGEKLKYVKLDAMEVAKLAYESKANGCMYQVFHAIITKLAESASVDADKFKTIPTALSVYGGGGVSGQGTVCGNLNGVAMVGNILDDINGQGGNIIAATFRWYETESLPYMDKAFVEGIGSTEEDTTAKVVVASVANSSLCHASLTRWCAASGKTVAEKGERCPRLAATIAHKMVELLNEAFDGATIGDTVHADNGECTSCHAKSETVMSAPSVMTGMECQVCHTGHYN